MVKKPEIICVKQPRISSGVGFIITPLDLAGEGVISQSNAYQISLPLLWVMRFLGRIHYIDKDGWLKSSFISLPFAYSLVVLIVNVGCHIYYRMNFQMELYDLSESITFKHVLFSTMIVLQGTSIVMTVFSWIFEVPSIVRNYNSTAVLERKLDDVFPSCVLTTRKRTVWKCVLLVYLVGLIVGDTLLLVFRYRDQPLPIMIMFMFNCVAYQTHSVMWCINNLFTSGKAVQLKEALLTNLQGINRANKISMCRKAWVSIWEQSQKTADSFSTTVIWCMLGHSIIFVTSSYGLIVSTRKLDVDEALATAPYFLTGGSMMFSMIETAHRAKNKLGNEFLKELINIDTENMDRECQEEIEKFINLILRTDTAQITLKGYLTMTRPLFVSFLSLTVTYLIVLIQFHQSEELAQKTTTPPAVY